MITGVRGMLVEVAGSLAGADEAVFAVMDELLKKLVPPAVMGVIGPVGTIGEPLVGIGNVLVNPLPGFGLAGR